MSTSSPLRRSAYGLGAAAVLTLTLSGPASARPESPTYAGQAGTAATVVIPRAPEPSAQHPGPPSFNSTWPGWSSPSDAGAPAGSAGDGTVPYLQIGLGALGGAALASAAALTVTRGRRGHLAHA